MFARIVGRDAELAAVRELLDAVPAGPSLLELWGEAGIGKTTVWEAGIAAARDRNFAAFTCRPAASEVRLSYAGLADLMTEVGEDVIERLPPPQRVAVDASLLRGPEDIAAPDPRAVAAGFLSVLNGVAEVTPVLVAIDDLQWLDKSTRRVVEFAVRRCRGPIAILSAERGEGDQGPGGGLRPPDPARLRRLRIGPLTMGALHHVLRQATGRSFARPVMARIVETSGGNPFYALELARALPAHGADSVAFSSSLRQVVRAHVDSLEAPVREALLVASALAEPRLDLVARAIGDVDVAGLLASAEDTGVVRLSEGLVRFTHPLLATGVYSQASPTKRRALHRRLSALVDDVEERARHLAHAATGPDAEAVAALEEAAERSRRRGAVSAAAELLDLAIGLGATDRSRLVQAARDHFHADNPGRARELLGRAIADLGPGEQRAEALGLLGAVIYETEGFGRGVEMLEQAFAEAEDNHLLRAWIATELCIGCVNMGRVADGLSYAMSAAENADEAGDDGLLAEALVGVAIVRFLSGLGIDETTLARALALEDPERVSHALRWPSLNATMIYLWTHQLDRARAGLAALRQRCIERGAENDLWYVLAHSMNAALWAGEVEAAEGFASEMAERAEMAGGEQLAALALAANAVVAGWTGRVDESRAAGQRAVAGLAETRFAGASLFAVAAVGMAELSVGDHAAAAQWLAPAAAQMLAMGFREPAVVPFFPDAAEALIAGGRLDEAKPLVELLEASGGNPGRTWAEAVGARCRGLLLASEGRLDHALAAFERALAAHDRLPLSYEKGRTLLARGRLQRRQNERRAAKASLEEAARLFEEVGAAQWAANARAELDRLGLRPGPPDELTATEQRIAELAASGKTTRQVAAELVVSPKTVEANLARAYRKLGIHSRAELGRRMADRITGDEPANT
jgi:DNA-binding NarL/FixJ family response regulator